MSPKSKEELHRFEQRMHDKGSDGFADGPRPWEHWDESGNQANSRVTVEVADTGHGIEKENLLRIFDPFFTTKSKTEGTGLGLSICKRIVEAHNGSISVTSSEGRGTTVEISFPV